ncbi:WXG100 family type VII secretion target [Streptomyces sp. I05A-00742]|uniref:WXG100 family type VII secretion target n=1 Tax=Streptomyces sp. I05A-00742 TaxID=2732853 RepID=UPI0014892386|nr:hypothetical protein [Streptomyces sp. I05A-00742]
MTGQGRGKDPRRPFERAPVPDFIHVSHEQLWAMIEHADAGKIDQVAKKLHEAANTIREIGTDLKEHAGKVDIRSEGGTAFHTWGADMGNATVRLADYSEKAGDWLAHAANTLRAVKTEMPPVPTAAKATLEQFDKLYPGFRDNPLLFNNEAVSKLNRGGPSTFQVAAAAKEIAEGHKEAAGAMRKLANQYNDSGEEISGATRPNFPPMPGVMMPEAPEISPEHITLDRAGGGVGGGSSAAFGAVSPGADAGGSSSVPSPSAAGGGGASSGSPGGAASVPHVDRPDSSTRVDGGVTYPQPPSAPTVPDGGPTPTSPGGGPSVPPTGPLAPPHLPSGPVPGRPPAFPSRPGRVPPSPEQGGGPATRGSRQGPVLPSPGGGPGTGRIGAPAPGTPGVPRSPGTADMPPVAMGGPADGVVGGRPTPRAPGQTLPGMPRGTVIGAEPGATGAAGQGHPGMGYGPGFGGMPGGPMGGGGTGRAGGRRLVSEAGGVVGSRASQGAVADGSPFTQGGTGLLRNSGEQERGRGTAEGRRPDHLVEERESWTQGEQGTVPPLVE